MWTRSSWRASSAFFGDYWYRRSKGASTTPADLLNQIYDERYSPKLRSHPDNLRLGANPRYELTRLANHSNVDLELAIKLSQCGIEPVQKLGFAKIVELS